MADINRRDFARTCVAAAVGILSGASVRGADQMLLSFSTLGCPKWDWETILNNARTMGYAGVEVRGVQREMDLPALPLFSGTAWKDRLKEVESRGLKIINLGTSTQLHQPDRARQKEGLDAARRFIDLAQNLKCPYIRVFGDKYVPEENRQATTERIISGLRELGEHAKGSGVTVLIEAHGDFNQSPVLLEILQGAKMPEVGLLWDAHHTFRFGEERPADTWKQLSGFIRHTHLKDSRQEGSDVRYVLTGSGTVPVRETVEVLVAGGYRGFYSLEWEKGWHAELEEPEVAFPHFVKVMKGYLGKKS
jgi:sugar phosphate isomerase/epimerase